MVDFAFEPLGRIKLGRAGKVSVRLLLEQRPAAKVDQLDLTRFAIQNYVFVLDVAMDDAASMDMAHRLHNLKVFQLAIGIYFRFGLGFVHNQ